MDAMLTAVEEFHKTIGADISTRPTLLPTDQTNCQRANEGLQKLLDQIHETATDDDILLCRLCLSLKETVAWLQGHLAQDLVASADAIGDRMYVPLGDAVAPGMPLQRIVEEVRRSNMSKSNSLKGELGKADKSGAYSRPGLSFISEIN